jgi:hypothetical protein
MRRNIAGRERVDFADKRRKNRQNFDLFRHHVPISMVHVFGPRTIKHIWWCLHCMLNRELKRPLRKIGRSDDLHGGNLTGLRPSPPKHG